MASTAPHSVRLILNTALSLTALGVLVRASSALKEIVFAHAFGVSADTDAFVLAGTFAMFLPTIVGGAIATALIAARSNTSGSFHGAGLLKVLVWITIAGIVATIAIYALAPFVMSGFFNLAGADLQRAVWYTRLLSPLGVTIVLASAMNALLNSAKQFYLAGMAAAATPLFILAAIYVFAERWGIEAAAWGTIAGGLVEVAVLGGRIVSQRRRFFAGHASFTRSAAISFWRTVMVLSVATGVSAISGIVDQFFLSKLETGAITNFNYASKVNSLLIGVFGTALSAAIYPYLSDLAAQRNSIALKRLTWRVSTAVLPMTALATVVVFVFSYEIVEVLFARGRFTATAALQVGEIQRVFALQLPFYVAGLIAMRVLNATGASDFVFWIACSGTVSNLVFDWLFYERLGASGIALASVLTSVMSLILSLLLIRPMFARARAGEAPS